MTPDIQNKTEYQHYFGGILDPENAHQHSATYEDPVQIYQMLVLTLLVFFILTHNMIKIFMLFPKHVTFRTFFSFQFRVMIDTPF